MAENATPRQDIALTELRRLITDIPDETYKDPNVLIKFLIARDFNVKQAESMIRQTILWKKEMQTDTLLRDFKPPEVIVKHAPIEFIGFSKDGIVVRYLPVGKTDYKGILKSTNSICFMKYTIMKVLEDIKMHESQSKKLGESVKQTINIYDAKYLTFAKITSVQNVQMFLKCSAMLQDNFPEFMKKVYVINASQYFTAFWPVIEKCIGSSLLKKIVVYGHDGWKEEFLRIMDADVLPAYLGGNRKYPLENSQYSTNVNHLPDPVPEKYYLEKNLKIIAEKPGVKSVRIDRQRRMSELIQVTDSNSTIHWEFELKSYDIGFGLLLEAKDGVSEELIPVHRIATELEPYMGKYRCKKPGKHLVLFDNSYSRIHCKEIYYRTWLTKAEDA